MNKIGRKRGRERNGSERAGEKASERGAHARASNASVGALEVAGEQCRDPTGGRAEGTSESARAVSVGVVSVVVVALDSKREELRARLANERASGARRLRYRSIRSEGAASIRLLWQQRRQRGQKQRHRQHRHRRRQRQPQRQHCCSALPNSAAPALPLSLARAGRRAGGQTDGRRADGQLASAGCEATQQCRVQSATHRATESAQSKKLTG